MVRKSTLRKMVEKPEDQAANETESLRKELIFFVCEMEQFLQNQHEKIKFRKNSWNIIGDFLTSIYFIVRKHIFLQLEEVREVNISEWTVRRRLPLVLLTRKKKATGSKLQCRF